MTMGVEIIEKYFPNLTPQQRDRFIAFGPNFIEWNNQINLISRKDTENLYERHILHSLGIAKVIRFTEGTKIMDVGTGGGFPGLPLAIMFPETEFTLVDSIGKKIKVVQEMAKALDLKNVQAFHSRAEDIPCKFDFITGRAVTDLNAFYGWVKNKISNKQKNGLPNGIIYLKGGDMKEELAPFRRRAQIFPLPTYFEEPFFETKAVVYIEAAS
jgi:16S rRNA (guanine527-N7)-methyltransferase